MKKILFISKNLDIGGMEKALILLLNKLVTKYEITLILEEKKGILLPDLDSRIKVEEYKLSSSKNVFVRKCKNLIHKTIWKWQNHNKYDFTCNYATYSLIGSYLARIASTNNALYVHSNYYEAFNHNEEAFQNFFNSLKVAEFKKIIFVSNEGKSSFNKIYPSLENKTVVINNLIDYQFIQAKAAKKIKLPYQKDKLNLLFVGRLDNDSKNFKRMFKSMALAIKENPQLNLYIIGDGKDKKLCEDLLKKYQLEKHVFMLGSIKEPYQQMKNCDAFLLTSNYEGFPVVLIEALVLNVPIISTISASDTEIDLQDYILKIPLAEKDIAQTLSRYKKSKVNYKLDFAKINQKRIEKIMKIIDE